MDKSKLAQLKVLIRNTVNEELAEILPDVIAEIKKVVDDRVKVLLETANKSNEIVTEKVRSPVESKITREMISEMLGVQFDSDSGTIRASTRTMNSPTPPKATGTPAEEVVRAITRDYSDMMAKLNELRPDVKGVYR